MAALVATNYPAPQENGRSIAIDGVAFDDNGKSLSTLIVEAPEEEGIYLAEFDIKRLRHYREKETWGNAYRRPSCYQLLISSMSSIPF